MDAMVQELVSLRRQLTSVVPDLRRRCLNLLARGDLSQDQWERAEALLSISGDLGEVLKILNNAGPGKPTTPTNGNT
jgi:hypothetical protein